MCKATFLGSVKEASVLQSSGDWRNRQTLPSEQQVAGNKSKLGAG